MMCSVMKDSELRVGHSLYTPKAKNLIPVTLQAVHPAVVGVM